MRPARRLFGFRRRRRAWGRGVTCACGLQVFFFNDTPTTEIYTLPLHDALPISHRKGRFGSELQEPQQIAFAAALALLAQAGENLPPPRPEAAPPRDELEGPQMTHG